MDTRQKWKNTALLVIDMQKDFIAAEGSMRVDGGIAIVPNVIKAVEVARHRGILVIWISMSTDNNTWPKPILGIANGPFTSGLVGESCFVKVVREHDPLGRDVELFRRHLYSDGKPKPTSKDSVGSELVDGLVIKEEDYKLVKTRFSAFFATHLHSLLQGAGINSLVVTGVQTPNCIRQTVFDAVALDYQSVSVIVDATAAATPDIHVANIFDMKNVGVATPTLQEWCKSED